MSKPKLSMKVELLVEEARIIQEDMNNALINLMQWRVSEWIKDFPALREEVMKAVLMQEEILLTIREAIRKEVYGLPREDSNKQRPSSTDSEQS